MAYPYGASAKAVALGDPYRIEYGQTFQRPYHAAASLIMLTGFYVPSANTTLILRIAGEAAASITYMAGSWMRLLKIP